MTTKRIQLLMLLGVCAITLHFTLRLGAQMYDFWALRQTAKAHITQWEVEPIKDLFSLKATYCFEAQGKTYPGKFTLSPPYHLNELSAISDLRSKAKDSWDALFNPNNPFHSALQKAFPFGLLIRTLICYGVLAYFVSLYKRLDVV